MIGNGWLVGVYRAEDRDSKENLLPHEHFSYGPERGYKVAIEADDWARVKVPLRFPIGSTGWDLSVCLVDAKEKGRGAQAGFLSGYIDFRFVVGESKEPGQ